MADVKTDLKLSYWPSPQDYNEAIQNLRANTQDPHLQHGKVEVTSLGLPRPLCGAFASVYRVKTPPGDVAVRCFLRDISDQQERYRHISDFVQSDDLPYTVTFDFIQQGLRVGAGKYPILKMDWVEGLNLDLYVEKHLGTAHIAKLAENFRTMCFDLRRAGIAHGDLQHGNIIVCGDELRLVDYDGMFVPAMQGMLANELGHRNYQHPDRDGRDFGNYLDNFSAWVIYTSLRAIAIDPRLYDQLGAGDDCLLFRRDDFVDPEHSYAFAVLEHHPNAEIRLMVRVLRAQCHCQVHNVVPLSDTIPEVNLPPLTSDLQRARKGPRHSATESLGTDPAYGLPEWLDHTASHVVAARPRPKSPPSRSQPANLPTKPDDELDQPIPRRVRWTQTNAMDPEKSQWVLWVFNPLSWILLASLFYPAIRGFAVFCLVVNVLLQLGVWGQLAKRNLLRDGTAVRTKSFSVTPDDYLDENGNVVYVASYVFYSQKGRKPITARKRISQEQYNQLAGSTEQTVLFSPVDPHNNELYRLLPYHAVKALVPTGVEPELLKPAPRRIVPHQDYFANPAAIQLLYVLFSPTFWGCFAGGTLGAFCVGITALVTWLIWRKEWRHKRLVKHGIPARAVIKRKKYPKSAKDLGTIEFEFQSIAGPIRAWTQAKLAELDPMSAGDVVTVLYDMEKPSDCVLYQLAHYRAVQ